MSAPTRNEVIEVLAGAFDRASNGRAALERLPDDARIIEDLGLSSLDLLDLRCELEEHWSMKIADEELAEIESVGDLVRLIQQRGIRPG